MVQNRSNSFKFINNFKAKPCGRFYIKSLEIVLHGHKKKAKDKNKKE